MSWNKEAFENYLKAVEILTKIKDETFELMSKNIGRITEREVAEFILRRIKEEKMTVNLKPKQMPIVAAGKNTAIVHYYPSKRKSSKITKNKLVLIDLWARLRKKNAPYADVTWMFYLGKKVPKNIEKVFEIVIKARDETVNFIKKKIRQKNLPTGKDVDSIARSFITKKGFGKNFLHSTGHVLGFSNAHGKGVNFRRKTKEKVRLGFGYTVEPGIYIKNKFGVRSEIDIFPTKSSKPIVTTPVQKKLLL